MRGYTLVEVIVVMLIITVLAAVAMPRLMDRSALQERGFRDQLKAMLDHAHKLAVVQQREVCVLIDATQAQAVYVAGGACSPAQPVSEPGGRAAFVLPVPAGVATGGSATLRFNARGQPVPNINHNVNVGALGLSISRETGVVQ